MLFTSLTGKRLVKHLGKDVYDLIEWDNASPLIGEVSSAAYPPDLAYIKRCLFEEGFPSIILCLGAVAAHGVRQALTEAPYPTPRTTPVLLTAPHPARRVYPGAELDRVAKLLRQGLRELGWLDS